MQKVINYAVNTSLYNLVVAFIIGCASFYAANNPEELTRRLDKAVVAVPATESMNNSVPEDPNFVGFEKL
jgi:hypothetical protein